MGAEGIEVSYDGWYGLGSKDHSPGAHKHAAKSILSHYKDAGEISQMVTALNSCKETQFYVNKQSDGFYI